MTGWLIMYQNQLKISPAKKFLELKNSIIRLYDGVKKTLNGQTEDNTAYENEGDIYYISIEMSFNSLMTELLEGIDINDLI